MKWHILDSAGYDLAYKVAFEPVLVQTEKDKGNMRSAISMTQKLIEDALLVKWKKEDDFEVGDDFDYCYHVCGGIYSDAIIGTDYVDTIIDALRRAPEPQKWTYHTACEPGDYYSEFFIRDGEGYIESSAPPQLLERLACR